MPGWGLWISGHPAWQQAGARDLVEVLPTRCSLKEPEFRVGPQPLCPQSSLWLLRPAWWERGPCGQVWAVSLDSCLCDLGPFLGLVLPL